MSEAAEWKKKYRDSLVEMENEEKLWRQTEQALRRLVGRLCAAGMGVHQQLDDELIALAAANRRNAAAAELEKLAESLTTTVVAVDAVAPVPTVVMAAAAAKRWDTACAATAKILKRLGGLVSTDSPLPDLTRRLAKAGTDGELGAVLDKTADLVEAHADALAQERMRAATVFAEVTARLEEMAGYLAASGEEARSRYTDTAAVNDKVMAQVRELTAEVNSATELNALQTLVTRRLQAVSQQVLDFRAREENRLREQIDRTERMHSRIADLERETQDLHTKLDQEKFGARHDPLTLVANRKAFDERFAQIMLARAENGLNVSVLLWDLDNFKLINDTYGHRAGDRVLKTVASSIVAGLRPEDFVARIGGEEFIALLTDLTLSKAEQIANELRLGIEALRFHFRGKPVRVTVSCGLTELRVGDTGTVAFDRADAALYRAKHAGKNLCVTG